MLLPAAVDDRAALQFLKTLSASSHADLEFLRGHSGARGGLTAVEQSLVENVGCGEWLDLAGDEAVDEAAMKSWGDSRTCRASVIRDILRGGGSRPTPTRMGCGSEEPGSPVGLIWNISKRKSPSS